MPRNTVSPLLVLTPADEPMYSYDALTGGMVLLSPPPDNGPAGLEGDFLAYSQAVPDDYHANA